MSQKPNWLVIFLIGVVIVGIIGPANVRDYIMGVEAPEEDKDKDKEPVEFCSDPSVTLTVGPMQKMYAPTTSVATEYARLFVEGIDEGLKVDSATKGVSWEDKVEVYYAENSSTYYAAKTAFEVPCKSTINSQKYDGDAHKLYQLDGSTNLNFKFFCEDDGLLNADSTAEEEIAAGDIVSISGVVRGQYEDAFSPYGGVYATLK